MEYKVDIRFLVLSVVAHAIIFYLLAMSFRTPINLSPERVEITLKDDHQQRQVFVPRLKNHEDKKEDNIHTHIMSDQVQRFQKQTVAQNLGVPENQRKQQAQKQEQPHEDQPGPSYLKMPQQFTAAQDTRQSAINFELPNVSKGEFTFLNSDYSTYAAFYNRITPLIMYRWGNNIQEIALFPHVREKLLTRLKWTTRVELVLDRTGHYVETIVENTCGSPELDQAIVGALKEATPFINPPTGMIESDGKVHIQGEFSVYTQRPRIAE